jgi:DNA-directed RNA polymerase subunit omega
MRGVEGAAARLVNPMATHHDTMIDPRIEDLYARTDSKFKLVILSAKRARQINSYFGQLGEGLGAAVPPQVTSTARKPLSIAFEEIAVDKIVPIEEDVDDSTGDEVDEQAQPETGDAADD